MQNSLIFVGFIYFLINQLVGNQNELKPNLNSNNYIETRIFKNNYNGDVMLKDENKKIVLLYLKQYESKDLKGIENIFSNDIVLRDWKIRVVGKEKALVETKKNFESVDSIKIEVLELYENCNTIAAELKIIINNSEELYVVDVITINSEGKINSIKAFIGRGN